MKYKSLSSNWMSSNRWYVQALGAMVVSMTKFLLYIVLSTVILVGLYKLWCPEACVIGAATIGVLAILHIVRTLNPVYCLRKEESRITWSQIVLLASFGVWLILVISQLEFKSSAWPTIISVVGAVISWIFKDTIKSVVAFFYLRANDVLKIGDWIEVKSHGIDGEVIGISLTTVTVRNWDTTISAFPTYILHFEHFKNNQKMKEGKTFGRQMLKTFTIDIGWIHYMSEDELLKLKDIIAKNCPAMSGFYDFFMNGPDSEASDGKPVLNIRFYRHYIYHWLMQNEHVSQEPLLLVRWLEQTGEGLPLQVYAYIIDSDFAPFEWYQSQIIEHIVESLSWFDLQLYQSPSGYNVSNGNVTLVENKANYRKGQCYE